MRQILSVDVYSYGLLGSVIAFLVVQHKTRVGEEVFIPPAQRRIRHLVKNISDRPENREIRVSQFGSDTNLEVTGIPIHLRPNFEPSEDKVNLLGIRFYDAYIQYEGNVRGRGYVSFRILRKGTKPPPHFYPLEVADGPRPGISLLQSYR